MKKLELVPKAKYKTNDLVSINLIYAKEIEKILSGLIKNIERLEDKIAEIEYRLKNHINTFDDIAHKI